MRAIDLIRLRARVTGTHLCIQSNKADKIVLMAQSLNEIHSDEKDMLVPSRPVPLLGNDGHLRNCPMSTSLIEVQRVSRPGYLPKTSTSECQQRPHRLTPSSFAKLSYQTLRAPSKFPKRPGRTPIFSLKEHGFEELSE